MSFSLILEKTDKNDSFFTYTGKRLYLSGRYVEIHIQSLSYSEFLLFHRLPDTDDTFLKYLTWGGLPQLAHIGLDNRQMLTDYLGDIYNTVIMKDVISRESIRNVRFLTDLVRFVGDNIGKNISANSIKNFMLSQNITISPTLTSNYLSYLCNAYISRILVFAMCWWVPICEWISRNC